MRAEVALALGSIFFWAGRAEAVEQPDLASLSIEQLAQIKVTSASKTAEPLSEAPAALYVITGQDIENSGVVSLPEALRLAPNLHVQQVTASSYSISARGFNGIQAGNKLLVLIDGRSIYTPLADNIIWELHQPLIDVVFSDVVMPGMGGLRLSEHLAQEKPDLPVILATGYSQEIAKSGSGGRPVLLKPYRLATLSQALVDAISGSQTG